MSAPGPDTDQQLALALGTVAVAFDRFRLTMARGMLGIGNTEMLTVIYLAINGPVIPSRIAEKLQVASPTVTGIVDRLEAEDLARRRRHPLDRRMLVVELTDTGRDATRLYLERVTAVVGENAAGLTPAGYGQLLRFLHGVAGGLADASGPDHPVLRVENDEGDGLVLSIGGELDFTSARSLRPRLLEHIGTAGGAVTIDLAAVTYVGSAGIRLLGEARHSDPGRVRLRTPWESPAGRILRLAGFPITPGPSESSEA